MTGVSAGGSPSLIATFVPRTTIYIPPPNTKFRFRYRIAIRVPGSRESRPLAAGGAGAPRRAGAAGRAAGGRGQIARTSSISTCTRYHARYKVYHLPYQCRAAAHLVVTHFNPKRCNPQHRNTLLMSSSGDGSLLDALFSRLGVEEAPQHAPQPDYRHTAP